MSRAPDDGGGPPARRQRTLLGFLKMSSLTRHSLEEMEVAAGTLAPEQTRNHQVWGPLALYSASPEALGLNEKYIAPGGVLGLAPKSARPGRKTWVGRAAEPGP